MKNILHKIDHVRWPVKPLYVFLLIWFTINFIQAGFTELMHDESYYWVYSRYPDWGYYDHPPLLGLLIKIGYSIFPNELGVRLMTLIMGTGTLFFIYKIIDHPKKHLSFFIILVSSIVLIQSHVCSFLAIPDLPVIFFSALFIFLYKSYLKKDGFLISVMMGIVAALMLYSKYHGLLVLFFLLLSNINLLKRRSFWIIVIIFILLMIPHLIWQIKHGFTTFVYHLFERSSHYKINHSINFITSQILVAGPLVAPVVLFFGFTYKAKDQFDKSLKYLLTGVYIFFFLSSFKGHTEAHWTAIAYIPLVVLSYKGIIEKPAFYKYVNYQFLITIAGFFIFRIFLIYDFLPEKWQFKTEFHNWDKMAHEIRDLADGRKVVFTNSFQNTSKYRFYTKEFAHSLNNIYYRKNQYDIWKFEDSVQDKSVVVLSSEVPDDTIRTSAKHDFYYEFVDDFRSFYGLKIEIPGKRYYTGQNYIFTLPVDIWNPTDDTVFFSDQEEHQSFISYTYITTDSLYDPDTTGAYISGRVIMPNNKISEIIEVKSPAEKGEYELYISIATGNLLPAYNSPPVELIVE